MKKYLKKYLLILITLTLTANTACTKPPPPKELDKVSVRLKWLHSAQFAGLYVAEKKGFYRKANIQVDLEEGGIKVDEVEMVHKGINDFGIVGAHQLVIARTEGIPLTSIAVIFRKNPSVFISLKGSGIKKPQDFVGKRILYPPANISLASMMKLQGISMKELILVPPSYDLGLMERGEVDVWTGYLINQVITMRQKGYQVNIIYPDEYGVHIYGDAIVATEKLIEENPELVTKFLRATLRGWRYAIENPEESLDILSEYQLDIDREHALASLLIQIPLIQTGENDIGWMRDDVWLGMQNLLFDNGLISEKTDIDKAYTTEFLKKIYGK